MVNQLEMLVTREVLRQISKVQKRLWISLSRLSRKLDIPEKSILPWTSRLASFTKRMPANTILISRIRIATKANGLPTSSLRTCTSNLSASIQLLALRIHSVKTIGKPGATSTSRRTCRSLGKLLASAIEGNMADVECSSRDDLTVTSMEIACT